MAKKILIAVLFVLVAGAGIFGTLHFKGKMDNQITQNTSLSSQVSSLQSELSAIGTMVTVYAPYNDIKQTDEIKAEDLKALSIPQSAVNEKYITDISQVEGKLAKIDISAGTHVTTDLFMDDTDDINLKFWRNIALSYIPVTLKEGDFIDVTAQLANGEKIPVLTHKQVFAIDDDNLSVLLKMSLEEYYCWDSALMDYALFNSYGFVIYPSLYINPGTDSTVAYYPVQLDAENMVKFDPNVVDKTRCVNTSLREHIDLVNALAATETNAQLSTYYTTVFKDEAANIIAAREAYLESLAEAAEDDLQPVVEDTTDSSTDTGYDDSPMSTLETTLGTIE